MQPNDVEPTAATAPSQARDAVRLVDAVWLSLAAALLFGGAEALYWLVKQQAYDSLVFMHPDYAWMGPVALVPLFAVVGLTAWAVMRRRPKAVALGGIVAALAWLGFLSLTLAWLPELHLAAGAMLCAGFAAVAGRTARARSASTLRFSRWATAGLALLLALAAWSSPTSERRATQISATAPADAPNVLLLVLDTVRADALWAYGADEQVAPNLARLAADSVVLEQATTTAPWTLPSMAGMFTGRPPHELSADWFSRLDGAHRTLAEELSEAGWATAGVVGNVRYCSAETGLARGFDHYEGYRRTPANFARCTALGRALMYGPLPVKLGYCDLPGRKRASQINVSLLEWLDRRGDRPYFAFVNYWDAHDPYVAPAEFRTVSTDEHKELIRSWWWMPKHWVTAEEIDVLQACYRDCLRGLDAEVGRLLAELERRGELDNTLVIVTADHGEHFGEHGLYLHGNSLYQELIHVPLIVSWPGRIGEARRVPDAVSLQGLPATVCEMVGLSREAFPGPAFTHHLVDGVPAPDQPPALVSEIASQAGFPPCHGHSPVAAGPMRCVRQGPLKLIQNGDGRTELYNLEADPHEEHNLAEQADAASQYELLGAVEPPSP